MKWQWRIVHEATDLLNDWCRVCLIGPLGETFAQSGILMDADNKLAARSYAKLEPAGRSAPAVMLEWSL